MAAVKNLDLWLRPAVLFAVWVLVAAFTLAQLGTVAPLLQARGAGATHIREASQRILEARTQPTRRRPVAR
jgi:hypothetical protein